MSGQKTKRQKTKRQKDKKTKKEFNILMPGLFCTLAMFFRCDRISSTHPVEWIGQQVGLLLFSLLVSLFGLCLFVIFSYLSGRIVGGEEAKRLAFPWQVAIMRENEGIVCGGSLLSKQWAVSASHCFSGCPKFDTDDCTMYACPYKNSRDFDSTTYMLRFGEFEIGNTDTE